MTSSRQGLLYAFHAWAFLKEEGGFHIFIIIPRLQVS